MSTELSTQEGDEHFLCQAEENLSASEEIIFSRWVQLSQSKTTRARTNGYVGPDEAQNSGEAQVIVAQRGSLMNDPVQKSERHVTVLPREIDEELADLPPVIRPPVQLGLVPLAAPRT